MRKLTIVLATVAFGICLNHSLPEASAKSSKLSENDFILGKPDKSVAFPEEAFDKAKALKVEKNLEEAEEVLMLNLDKARLAGRGSSRLGKYLIRLNNIAFALGKDKKAIKYGTIGVKLIALDYKNKDSLIGWQVNGLSYLAMSYDRQKKYSNAIQKYKEAINLAESAPEGKISPQWIETLKKQMLKAKSKYASKK